MNPFDSNQQSDFCNNEIPGQKLFSFINTPQGITILDKPSKVEQTINKTSDSLERCFKMLILAAGLCGIVALFPPFLRFLYEFSIWAFRKVGGLFS
jgi:hypothetical protein